MDQAWQCEEDFWQAGIEGRVAEHYARVLASDAFVVVPDRVLNRDDLLQQWQDRAAWAEYTLAERRDVLINGETAVLSYRVSARQVDGHPYTARVSSVYTWITGWALAFRQHTPDTGSDPRLAPR
ncbi:hypothetical protein GCM10022223_50580 [Kineosporia mesophila]|uniref:DUF4440 domain-containing protein n=1 Tax=Kineosporia mesophila TaxID=566012 RepID=A0ABP7A8T7_9ACTN|nr:nuclear transport factor 2 family protein [Kineosporia mesophila]MCD5354631.1 nuclear transport factor 2 family protein [Kineosporia mesophila]